MEHIKKLRTFLSEKFWMSSQIKAAPHKSYKDIKTLSSSVKGGVPLYYPMNRDFYLSSGGVLLFVFLLFFINTFLPPAPSFQTLLKGLFLTEMANASCLKLMIGCAFVQLAWMPLIFYAVRSPMENYIYPGYFVSFKEKTLWKVYIILTLLYILILSHVIIFFVFILVSCVSEMFLPILSFAFKYLIQHIRGPRLNPSTGFNISSNLGYHMKIFVVFMFSLVFPIILQTYAFNDKDFFLKLDSHNSWQIYALIPFFQTFGIALFIGLKLFCFRACSQLIQDVENDPTSFAQSLESRVFRSQWRYFLKKGLDVFKDKRKVCLFLLGFFSLILCLTYGSVLVSQYDIFFSWKNLFIKDPGRGPMVFLAVLTFVPVLIYATKEISPDNGWPNYFAAFTRRPFWRIAHFLARVILLSAFLISMPIVQEQLNLKIKLYLFAFVSFFSVMPCLNLALRRDAFLQINLDFLFLFVAPMPILVITILEFCQMVDHRRIHSLCERIFTVTSFQDALLVSSVAVVVAGFFLYYVSFICHAFQDYLYLDNKGYAAYKRKIIARKRVQKKGGNLKSPPLFLEG